MIDQLKEHQEKLNDIVDRTINENTSLKQLLFSMFEQAEKDGKIDVLSELLTQLGYKVVINDVFPNTLIIGAGSKVFTFDKK